MDRKEMFAKAKELGLKPKGNASNDDLLEMIESAEIEAKGAEYETPAAEIEVEDEPKVAKKSAKGGKSWGPTKKKQVKIASRMGANRLVRCIITPLDETMRDQAAEMYSVGTSATGFVKKVVRFNEETLEPIIIVQHLKGKKMTLQVDTKKAGVAKLKRVPAFAIQVLPDFTPKELEELFAKNKSRG